MLNRLILENSIKITKIKIMRRETDKSGYMNEAMITIDHQIVIEEKTRAIEVKTKMLQ